MSCCANWDRCDTVIAVSVFGIVFGTGAVLGFWLGTLHTGGDPGIEGYIWVTIQDFDRFVELTSETRCRENPDWDRDGVRHVWRQCLLPEGNLP
ncbi:MAG: hypothetical protein MPK62_01060 [Alphaproteobacteria bacterium]|nr:hypothetical protein [Alphaproteobacteria bacterium]